MAKKLQFTKQDLIDWGFTIEDKGDGWYDIIRFWFKKGTTKKKTLRKVQVHNVRCAHKYGEDKYYPCVIFSIGNHLKSIPLSRLVYTWFIKPDGIGDYDIDHIDNDPYNNRLDNLQALSRKDNLAKRGYGRNQHNYNWSEEKIRTIKGFEKDNKDLYKEGLFLKHLIKEAYKDWRQAVSDEDPVRTAMLRKRIKALKRDYEKCRSKKSTVLLCLKKAKMEK